jgi:integrase
MTKRKTNTDEHHVRKGGRRKGDSGHRNDGLMKRCGCSRKRWSDCVHPWWFSYCIDHRSFRFNMTKRAGLPSRKALSRSDAEGLRDRFRTLARDGKITRRGYLLEPVRAATATAAGNTLRQVADDLIEHWKSDPNRRAHRVPILAEHFDSICRTKLDSTPFGDRVFAELTTTDIEAFRDARRRLLRQREAELAERRRKIAAGDTDAKKLSVSPEVPHARQGEVGINRSLERLRALFNWAIERGLYPTENPFLKNGRPAIKMAKELARTRRLQGNEEVRLLQQASPDLKDLIVAAVDTGMRRRELLSLQWRHLLYDAKHQPRAVMLAAENSKTGHSRTIPLMSARLRAVLVRRRLGPDGKRLGDHTHVFGNEVGEAVDNVKTAWRSACRRAGIEGLNFHDLRRECGSRWLEGGVGLLTVSALLGHTQVTTTNTYLASSPAIAEGELRAFEERRGNIEMPRTNAATRLAQEQILH